MKLVKVRVLAKGTFVSMVSYKNIRYEVNTSDMRRCYYDDTTFSEYCYIDETLLTKVW